jgi:RNA polymerase sigma-70 factor, ECF subfamily
VLGASGKQEGVSRVGLTAADLAGARRRDPTAISRVYTAYAPALYRFFVAALGDRHTAEDLTGAVFVSAIQSLPGFRGPVEALGGWLFRIARHDLFDFRRQQARTPRIESLDDALDEVALAAGADDPEELALERIEGDRMLAALRHLSPDQRDVLLLRMAGGLTAPEVASIVGKTTGAVKALQHRGLASLARVLTAQNHPRSPNGPYPSTDRQRLTSQEKKG